MNPRKFAYLSMVILGQILLLSWNSLLAKVDSLRAGDLIRLRLYYDKSMIAKFRNIQNDTLFFDDKGTVMGIAFSNIKALEVARGKKAHPFKGAAIGFYIGSTLGAIIGASQQPSSSRENTDLLKPIEEAFQVIAIDIGATIGGAIGLLSGAIVGSSIRSVNWVKVPLSSKGTMPQKYRWSFNVHFGDFYSTVRDDIETAIIRSGFADPLYIEETGSGFHHRYFISSYPSSNADRLEIGMARSLQINYSLKTYLSSSLLILHSPLAVVSGHHSNPEIFIWLKAQSIAFCPLLILKPKSEICGESEFGIGPGLFFNQIDKLQIGEDPSRRQKITMGMVGHIATRFPQHTRLFGSIGLQYRWTPKTTFGPLKIWSGRTSVVLDGFTTNFSHFIMNVGLGYQF